MINNQYSPTKNDGEEVSKEIQETEYLQKDANNPPSKKYQDDP
jgi:hypothetical protein